MKRFDIALVQYPFDELSGSKLRPGLCLTDAIGSRKYVVVAYITSQLSTTLLPSEFIIQDSHQDFNQTGLRASSMIQLQRLFSTPEDLILRKLGSLSESLQGEIKSKLTLMLLS
jgi:mRNA interferase MazF